MRASKKEAFFVLCRHKGKKSRETEHKEKISIRIGKKIKRRFEYLTILAQLPRMRSPRASQTAPPRIRAERFSPKIWTPKGWLSVGSTKSLWT